MSSVRQVGMQLRKLIREATHPLGAAEVVLGSSFYLSAGLDPSQLPSRAAWGLCLIDTFEADQDTPGLVTQTFGLIIATTVTSDPLGESSVIGANRTGGIGSTKGAGVLNLEAPILDAVGSLTGADGAPILVSTASGAAITKVGSDEIAQRQYQIRAVCTVADAWPAPSELVATDAGGGQITATWTLPPARYDLRSLILRYAPGATPPATPTAGTGVAIDVTDTTVTFTPSGGSPYSLALFAAYSDNDDPTHDDSVDAAFSAQEPGTVRASVVVA